MTDPQGQFNKQQLNISEPEVISLLSYKDSLRESFDLRDLMQLVTPDLEIEEYLEVRGLYIGSMILREEFGFDKGEQPGDFDMIIIPFSDRGIHFERVGVFEVKLVKPTIKNPERNANSLGTKQVQGLIRDGFPFVGLMHVSIIESLPEELKRPMKFCTLPVGQDTKFEPGKVFEDYLVDIKADHFSWFSADKQLKRLLSTDLPKYVCLHCFGLDKMEDGKYRFSKVSQHLECFSSGYFNPHAKDETIAMVKSHFMAYPEKYLKRDVADYRTKI